MLPDLLPQKLTQINDWGPYTLPRGLKVLREVFGIGPLRLVYLPLSESKQHSRSTFTMHNLPSSAYVQSEENLIYCHCGVTPAIGLQMVLCHDLNAASETTVRSAGDVLAGLGRMGPDRFLY
jgi:hypothetical protein